MRSARGPGGRSADHRDSLVFVEVGGCKLHGAGERQPELFPLKDRERDECRFSFWELVETSEGVQMP